MKFALIAATVAIAVVIAVAIAIAIASGSRIQLVQNATRNATRSYRTLPDATGGCC